MVYTCASTFAWVPPCELMGCAELTPHCPTTSETGYHRACDGYPTHCPKGITVGKELPMNKVPLHFVSHLGRSLSTHFKSLACSAICKSRPLTDILAMSERNNRLISPTDKCTYGATGAAFTETSGILLLSTCCLNNSQTRWHKDHGCRPS